MSCCALTLLARTVPRDTKLSATRSRGHLFTAFSFRRPGGPVVVQRERRAGTRVELLDESPTRDGQRHMQRQTAARTPRGPDPAAVRLDDGPAGGESHPEPVLLGADEALEDALDLG